MQVEYIRASFVSLSFLFFFAKKKKKTCGDDETIDYYFHAQILTSETAVLSNAGKPALVKALMHDTDISKLTLDDDSKSESVPITTVQGRITALEDVKRLCQGCDVLINW